MQIQQQARDLGLRVGHLDRRSRFECLLQGFSRGLEAQLGLGYLVLCLGDNEVVWRFKVVGQRLLGVSEVHARFGRRLFETGNRLGVQSRHSLAFDDPFALLDQNLIYDTRRTEGQNLTIWEAHRSADRDLFHQVSALYGNKLLILFQLGRFRAGKVRVGRVGNGAGSDENQDQDDDLPWSDRSEGSQGSGPCL